MLRGQERQISILYPDLLKAHFLTEIKLCGKSICSWCDGSSDQSFIELFLVPASVPQTGVTKAVVCVILSMG